MTSAYDLGKLRWYARRVKALENLLAYYRGGIRPSERLHRELEVTGQRIGHDGEWIDEATQDGSQP